MAKLSRNARQKARVRHNLSLANRQLTALRKAHFSTHLTLLMVLAQNSGEITVTQGTMQQVIQGVQGLNWQTFPGDNPNEFTVRLLTQDKTDEAPETEQGSKVQMTRLTDEEEAEAQAVEDAQKAQAAKDAEAIAEDDAITAAVEPFPGSSEVGGA